MKLLTEPYLDQRGRWPAEGRHIPAVADVRYGPFVSRDSCNQNS